MCPPKPEAAELGIANNLVLTPAMDLGQIDSGRAAKLRSLLQGTLVLQVATEQMPQGATRVALVAGGNVR